MLIVVAIIAVLVAIAIPVFMTQLENSREATDAGNIRSAYAEVMAAVLTDPKTDQSKTVEKQQTQENWQNDSIGKIANVDIADINSTTPTTIAYNKTTGKVTIDSHEVADANNATPQQP